MIHGFPFPKYIQLDLYYNTSRSIITIILRFHKSKMRNHPNNMFRKIYNFLIFEKYEPVFRQL